MGDLATPEGSNTLQITLYGTVRGRLVRGLLHAYAELTYHLELTTAIDGDTPWRKMKQDFFAWRKARVEEQESVLLSLRSAGFIVAAPPRLQIAKTSSGRQVYDPMLISAMAAEYSRAGVKAFGLMGGPT